MPESSIENEERQSRFELKTLLDTSRMLIESRETDFILNNLILITMGKLLVTRGCILLHEPDSNNYTLCRIKGNCNYEQGDKIEIDWKPGDLKSNVININDSNLRFPELYDNQKGGIFVNLRTSNHHIGYLFLGKKANGQPYSNHEIEFVESLCIISSVAIANSRMFSEMREINRKLDRRIYELNTLFDLSKDFNVMVDREKIASTFKFALLGQLLIRKFFLLYNAGDQIKLMGSSGLKKVPDTDLKKKIFDLADGVLKLDEHHYENLPILEENNIIAIVELQLQGEKTAVVGVGEKANHEAFTESDFNFLQSLGNLAVLSIQRTYFLEERIEKERLDEELNIAKTIQLGLFPDPIPEVDGLDLVATNIPSQQVGGDYFDIAQTPDSNYIFAIADVTGKGIPAALLMANLQSMLHVLLPVDITLGEATGRINQLIYENTPSDKFITFFWGKYFCDEKRFQFVNAGHNPPMLLRNNSDEIKELSEGGLILGAMPTMDPYEENEVYLKQGDIIVFFTDGVTETFNEEGEEYEEEKLREVILKNRDKSASELKESIIGDIMKFSNQNISDDLTLIIIKAA